MALSNPRELLLTEFAVSGYGSRHEKQNKSASRLVFGVWPRDTLSMRRIDGVAVVKAAQMIAAEDHAMAGGTSVDLLMARAGAAIAEAVWRFGGGQAVLVVCGPGNNGGDGYVAARLLRELGLSVRLAASAPPKTGVASRAAAGWTGPVEILDDHTRPAPVLVDALFGTGLTRMLANDLALPLKRLSYAAAFRVAVDLPSGVGSDDGAWLGAARADLTVVLGALKPAHLLQPAAGLSGTLRVADIGIKVESDVHVVARPDLPLPQSGDHKYRRGMAVIVAGAMPGAALLAAAAAQRAGAGYVVLAADHDVAGGASALVRRSFADAIGDARAGAIVIGCGLGQSSAARTQLDMAIASPCALVIDADGLNLLNDADLAGLAKRTAPLILTPHQGEFSRLFGHGSGSKVDRAIAAAQRLGGVIIYKGADTVVAAPSGRAAINPAAPAWLASAGTGDVLAGIAGAMLARGLEPFEAACAAVWLHSDAARRAGAALVADDLPCHLAAALGSCA